MFINPDDIEDTVFTGNLEIEGEKTWFPVDGFFGAPGFGNWQQGRGEKNYKHSKSSVDYVRELGATKAAFEPIKGVRIIVDSSGAAFYLLDGDGAHRLLSAKLRGENMIAVASATIEYSDIPVEELIEKCGQRPPKVETTDKDEQRRKTIGAWLTKLLKI